MFEKHSNVFVEQKDINEHTLMISLFDNNSFWNCFCENLKNILSL